MFKKKAAPLPLVIEIEKNTKLPELTSDMREALKVLPSQPAFNYLLQRMRLQKAAVRAALENGAQMDETQLRFCQAGIFWLGFIEREVETLTKTPTKSRAAFDNESAEFDKVRQNLELVGS